MTSPLTATLNYTVSRVVSVPVSPLGDASPMSQHARPRLEAPVIESVAEVLIMDPDQISPDQTFTELGLDSILTVEFTAALRRRTGIAVKAATVYDHPTPHRFAAFLETVPGGDSA
ncbi:acyl carrier protein [Nocardia panacis]|uniref:acyl carrier protein n=1 Tax=Nocardia panacis TaxID=2340916 RepID=UPI00131518E2|nr:acyl carrier protein [Nocardia panacis]